MAATSPTAGRIFGVLGIIFQIGMLFAYGFGSQLFNSGSIFNSYLFARSFLVQFILMVVFALLGFGLLLSFLKYGTWTGMATALLVISINIQLGLMMQKFWFSVFTLGFGDNTDYATQLFTANTGGLESNNAIALFYYFNQYTDIMPNVLTYRVAVMATISCLVGFLGFIGRIGLLQTFITSISFTIGWNLNYFLNWNLYLNRSNNRIAYDDYGTDFVYLFGSSFALFMMIMLNCRPAAVHQKSQYLMNRISGILGLMGTAFVFATFALTAHVYPMRTNLLSQNLESLNNIFALSASVIGTYIFSALFNKGFVGIREAMLGTITGGVLIGCVSNFLYNMAIAVSVGLFAGLLSAFWLSFIHPRINKNNVFDSHGVLGAFFITSIFGGIVFTPGLMQAYINNGTGGIFGNTQYNFNNETPGWHLVYAALSLGIGMAFGLGTGIVLLCFRNTQSDFNDSALFVKGDYGLYVQQRQEIDNNQQSAANLKNKEQK